MTGSGQKETISQKLLDELTEAPHQKASNSVVNVGGNAYRRNQILLIRGIAKFKSAWESFSLFDHYRPH